MIDSGRAGLLYQKFRDHFGRNDNNTLVVRGLTPPDVRSTAPLQ
jgi:hypothetical protein